MSIPKPSADLSNLPPQIIQALKELHDRDYASWGAVFPPPTENQPDPDLQQRIVNFHNMKKSGRSINRELRKSKAFNNPDILEKLVKRSGLRELGSNYPSHMFDPYGFSESDYYEQISSYPFAQVSDIYICYDADTWILFVQRNNKRSTTRPRKRKRLPDAEERLILLTHPSCCPVLASRGHHQPRRRHHHLEARPLFHALVTHQG
jgi:hypothetical protein